MCNIRTDKEQRYKVQWDDAGLSKHSSLLASMLPSLLPVSGSVMSPDAFSALLCRTNAALLQAARACFRVVDITLLPVPRRPKFDSVLKGCLTRISKLTTKIQKGCDAVEVETLRAQ